MSLGPLNPFDLPVVLEEIGTLLEPSDLYACALVSRHWHSSFAPFLYWLALEDCDAIAQRLYDVNIARPLKIGVLDNFMTKNFKAPMMAKTKSSKTEKIFDPKYRLEADYLAHIDTLVKRIEHSPTSFVHRQMRTVLSCRSFMSFILLGTLCNNIREIDFLFTAPPSYINPGPGISPAVCAISTKHLFTQERPDRVIEVIERSTRLERLVLKDDCEKHSVVYRWVRSAMPGPWRDVQLPLSAPRWPNLSHVQLLGCVLDNSFLRTLFVNTPMLKSLRLSEITIRSLSNPGADLDVLNPHPDTHPTLEELMIFRPKNYPMRMQMDLARVQPSLKTLLLTYGKNFDQPLFFAPGFHALRKLRVLVRVESVQNAYNFVPIVQAANQLEDLWIEGKVIIDEALSLAIKKHSRTLTKIVIDCYSELEPTAWHPLGSLNGPENPLHMILRSCYALKSCALRSPALDCDPAEFELPWACNEIEELTILPDCEPRMPSAGQFSSYTPEQAQSALFLQLSRLKALKTLDFGSGVGSRSFYVEGHLEMLCELDQLQVLSLYSQGLASNAKLTVEHAMLFANNWPHLKAIRGLYYFVCGPFVEYLKMHRPHLDLTF
ncbi:hypothetical protein BGZ72_004263 [Mortierella alpina]|nr:hypothetical protein BGZ72_004263 [Mortierella alpina]